MNDGPNPTTFEDGLLPHSGTRSRGRRRARCDGFCVDGIPVRSGEAKIRAADGRWLRIVTTRADETAGTVHFRQAATMTGEVVLSTRMLAVDLPPLRLPAGVRIERSMADSIPDAPAGDTLADATRALLVLGHRVDGGARRSLHYHQRCIAYAEKIRRELAAGTDTHDRGTLVREIEAALDAARRSLDGATVSADLPGIPTDHAKPVDANRRRGGRQTKTGVNDLATTHPNIAAQADGWDPRTVTAGSNKQKPWKCPFGHTWNARVQTRTSGSGCAVCDGKAINVGVNDLVTTHPDVAAQADGWDPRTVTAGSNKQKPWKCPFGHTWNASVNSRRAGSGCPDCAGRTVNVGFNDLATTHPDLAAQAHGWDPRTLTAGSASTVEWVCDNGHVWEATVNDRKQGNGCPGCSSGGFDQTRDGWLYLLRDPDRRLLKIGITNTPRRRLRNHQRNGWDVIDVRGPLEGRTCRDLESAVLDHVTSRGARTAKTTGLEAFDGWTEAWSYDDLDAASLGELLGMLEENRPQDRPDPRP